MQVHYYNELWAKYFIGSDKLQQLLSKVLRDRWGGFYPHNPELIARPVPGPWVCCFNSLMKSPALMSWNR